MKDQEEGDPNSRAGPAASAVHDIPLSNREFTLLRDLVHAHAGIFLGPHKKELLKARLLRRLRRLDCATFMDYYVRLRDHDPRGEERIHFVNALTTNVTEFFREEHHFRFIQGQWLPDLRAERRTAGKRRLRIWSAGCSTGEEPYSIAIAIRESLGPVANLWDVRILASDIDSDALHRAAEGIYPEERLCRVPAALHRRYFLRGTGANEGNICVRPELKEWIKFRRLSLFEEPWPIYTRFDAIFCRNVIIYFDRPDQQRVLTRLSDFLTDSGLLFLGHSEGVHGLNHGLEPRGPTIFRRVSTPSPTGPDGPTALPTANEERNPTG